MAKLIDADDVYSLFDINGFARLHVADIDTLPRVDAVEVVRCKDCKRWERHTEVNRDYGGCRRYNSTMRYDDFCSCVERKDGGGNG